MSTLFTMPRVKTRSPLAVLGVTVPELLLRPERFFRTLLRFRSDARPWLAIWVVGVAAALDRYYSRASLADAFGRSAAATPTTWVELWPMVLVGGILTGILAWYIQGWWFGVRVRWSGASRDDFDPNGARLVWLYSMLVWAVPSIAFEILSTFLHPDPGTSFDSASFGLTELGMMFWSIFVGYRGAVGGFPVRVGAARFWFLVLPVLFYATVLFGFVALPHLREWL